MDLDLRRLNTITQTDATRENITPEIAQKMLEEGNKRFVNNDQVDRNLLQQVKETGKQKPFATILGCIDSRVSNEIIFDQGIGDIFSIRIAGNIVNTDILGSMEFACGLAGTKIIVVLGHTSCGAVGGACAGLNLNHGILNSLLSKINPAVNAVKAKLQKDSDDVDITKHADEVAVKNVELTIQRIVNESANLAKLVEEEKIKIVGAMYNIGTGKVEFL
jgi:carbonic anhydrase